MYLKRSVVFTQRFSPLGSLNTW